MTPNLRITFFGTSHVAVYILDALERAGLSPALVITAPDAPRGRGMQLAAPAAKEWALARGIEVLQPEKLDDAFIEGFRSREWGAAVVCDYGKILPKALLDIPRRGFLNVHPSLLPRLRGASPIRSAILGNERETGVSVMLVDEKMDHGPLIAQKKLSIEDWPPTHSELERALMSAGGKLLAQVLPQWVADELEAQEQNHDLATYCEKIAKEDGLLDLSGDAYSNLLKICAFEGWPGTYAFFERGSKRIRVQILAAHLEGTALVIDTVKPEGKQAMPYADFLRSGATPARD